MSEFRARWLRRLRHELLSLALVAAVPVSLAIVFPYEAVGFRATGPGPRRAAPCAFVSLSAAEERAALAAARTAWQVDAKGVRGLRTDLSSGDLPPAPTRPVISVRRVRATGPAVASYLPNALPPTAAASRPAAIPPEAAPVPVPPPAFSREELLRID